MAKEIERKFLVISNGWRENAVGTHYRQGYLNSVKERTVRISVNFQRFPTLDAKKLVNAPKMSAHHRGICHF